MIRSREFRLSAAILAMIFSIPVSCKQEKFEIEALSYRGISALAERGISVTAIDELLGASPGIVCLLRPYAPGIIDEKFEYINDKISDIVPLTEGQFSIIWFDGESRRVNNFNRRRVLDVTPSMSSIKLGSDHYRQIECAYTDHSYFYIQKNDDEERIYISIVEVE